MTAPSPNNLGSVITSARARKIIYGTYVLAIIGIGGCQVAFAALEAAQPDWLTVSLAVAAYLGVPVAGLAAANTATKPEEG